MPTREDRREIENDVEQVQNAQLLLSPTMKQTELHGARSRRIKSVRSLIREHQNILKEIYGRDRRNHFGSRSRKSVITQVKKNAEELGESRLNIFETRLDIVRQRAGLASSPAQAAQRITMGQVMVGPVDWDDAQNHFVMKNGKVISSPNYRRQDDMMMLQIKPKYYADYVNMLGAYWESEQVHHVVPTYREVDYEKGAVVFLQAPKDGEVQRPKGCAVGRAARQSY